MHSNLWPNDQLGDENPKIRVTRAESPPTWCDTMTPKQLLKSQLEDADLECD